MSDDLAEETPRFRDLPREVWKVMRWEWNRRTRFGKALYPLWLVDSTIKVVGFLCFAAFLFTVAGFAGLLSRNVLGRSPSTPEVYKNE